MPNWCNNTVELANTDPAKLKEAIDAFNKGEFCNYAIPVPQDLKDTIAGSYGDDEKQALLEAKEKINFAKYGAKNWYDFCVSHWGTKWDVGGDSAYGDPVELKEGDTAVTISFDSAWAPPVGAYAALVEQGFEVRAYYYEPGMNFAGIWDNGSDEEYEIPGTAQEVRDEMPELDEVFGISDSMEMWEEDNKEEEAE